MLFFVTSVSEYTSPAILVACSRVLENLKDDRSAEILLLGCLVLSPNCAAALSRYGKLAARKVSTIGVSSSGPLRQEVLPHVEAQRLSRDTQVVCTKQLLRSRTSFPFTSVRVECAPFTLFKSQSALLLQRRNRSYLGKHLKSTVAAHSDIFDFLPLFFEWTGRT